MRTAVRCTVGLVVLGLGAGGAGAAVPFNDLLKRVPEQANAVLLLDPQAANNSPLGKREDWAKKHRQNFLGGLAGAAPTVTRALVAAQVNLATLQNTWEVALVQLQQPQQQADLVRAVSGQQDSLAGQPVVLSPNNAYFVPFEPRLLGMMRPA